jgi:UDP-N-acetyl-D-mannosaminuronic acid dehydrogenase
MSNVCILGLGYVGLTLALHAAKKGFIVYGIEILESTRERIHSGNAHFHEPGLNEALRALLGKKFFVYEEIPIDVKFEIFVVCVGTPLISSDIKTPNMAILDQSVRDVGLHVRSNDLVILRSTIPVGMSRLVEKRILEISSLPYVNISFCPERTSEGSALMELEQLPQVVSGNNLSAVKMANQFFSRLSNEIVEATSLEEAELTKLFNNVYRDAVFSLANIFNQIAQSYGVNGMLAINNANFKYPRSNIPIPGFVSGPCLEKDAYILASNLKPGKFRDSILAMRSANETLEPTVASYINQFMLRNPDKLVFISGLAFKGVPATNDLRGSSGIKILNFLINFSDRIIVHDFMNSKLELEQAVTFCAVEPDEFDCTNSCIGMLVLLNNHRKYQSDIFLFFAKSLQDQGCEIFDSWNIMGIRGTKNLSNFMLED